MDKNIKVEKITPDGLVECPLSEINVGDRFMFEDVEFMRIASWDYPTWIKGCPLYVNLNDYTVKYIGTMADDEEDDNNEQNDI